ncbi:hypothetical protein SUGI_0383900 [Cryptomeria japonica]|uniref:hevamine-A-like n=1 Tax=Cryptomeria japonica TaxID=3369 RepID=UPI002408C7C6|nr:hevamine-A-like [Cryptomeria japonica]GLJ21005.1 hypothetical protein SUGI_0383900 [Cryptomeria japonica]
MESRQTREARIAMVVALLWSRASASMGNINIYWGQNSNEASLPNTYASGNFEIVMLAFLNKFADGQTPVLNLAGHCDPPSGGCKSLSADIQSCQSRGVKVFMSLGGAVRNYKITSVEDAKNMASYLWDNFLGGQSDSRPIGDAVQDGIDFNIQNTTAHWDDLASAMSALSTPSKKIYLSAAPQCPYPDAHLITALQTGRFDYVWIQFYNNTPCLYANDNATNLVNSWTLWTTSIPTAQTRSFYIGLPAAPDAINNGGYVEPDVLISQVLPKIKPSSKYGGVMLWSKYWDEQTNYSSIIKDSIITKPSLVEVPSLAYV